MHPLVMTIDELHALITRAFPQAADVGELVDLRPGQLVLALRDPGDERHLRPGGTISGPVVFTLADLAFWLLVLSAIGPVPLAVTTSLNLNFLRKASPGPLFAHARLLKLGARLAVGDCTIVTGPAGASRVEELALDAPIAHAQVTYSIPPPDRR